MEHERANGDATREREARALDQAAGVFFSNMSHLIRTPLNGVIGMTELLLETELDPRQRMYSETVLRSGERLLRVVEDFLDYSKLEAGTMQTEAEDFELRTLLRKVNAPFLDLADDKGLFLHYSVGHDVPDALRGDADRIRQVLSNLLRHALASTSEGEVYLRAVLIEDSEEAATVRFEVIDTAPGVPPDVQEEILWLPTVPLGESIGTGMELAISRRLAGLMGGEMGVESEPDEGNVFFLELRLEKQPERPDYTLAPRFDLRGLRALTVGGDPTSRELLREQTASWQMHVDHADDDLQALALVREAATGGEPYDLMILDMEADEGGAMELARAVKSETATAETQLVLLSSLSQDELDERAEAAGVSLVLTKPVHGQLLYENLTELMSSRTGAAMPQEAPEEEPAASPESGERARRAGDHLLVVEDDPVNQIVAVRMLESLGYAFDLAKDGREAVEAFSSTPYAAILMDIQMPEMDGYEATAEIRGLEGPARRTPIIAMTANAMQGDRKKALEAGMDDYLPKPVKLADLESILARWTSRTEEDTVPAVEPPPNPEDPLDRAALESLRELQVEGEPDILREVVGAFLEDTPLRLADLRAAISQGDAQSVGRAAHALKGSCGNMGAVRMAQACEDLEEAGRSGNLSQAQGQLTSLEDEFARVRAALEEELSRV